MKISRQYARKLLRQGMAREDCVLRPDERGDEWIAITRLDVGRVDHYVGQLGDVARVKWMESHDGRQT